MEQDLMASRDHAPATSGVRELPYVRAALRGLTKLQRQYVQDGSIHGDCTMVTVRALQRRGLFYLEINSPNGRCGVMRLTPLGKTVQAILTRAKAEA